MGMLEKEVVRALEKEGVAGSDEDQIYRAHVHDVLEK